MVVKLLAAAEKRGQAARAKAAEEAAAQEARTQVLQQEAARLKALEVCCGCVFWRMCMWIF
jgi:hypothetical protein